jgi:hypothetical protein
MFSPTAIQPHDEFKILGQVDIQEALHERSRENAVSREIDRLVGGYCEMLLDGAASRSSPVSALMEFQPRWPIEAVAAQRARAIMAEALMTGYPR